MNQKIKINFKYILIIFAAFLIIMLSSNMIFAQISLDNPSENSNVITDILGYIINFSVGPLTAGIATIVNVLLVVVFILLYFLFGDLSNGYLFPFPDQIVFNKLPFFDPNFINPVQSEFSPVSQLSSTISQLYQTNMVIAGAIFTVCAMIVGIKLALSTIATDKAHYKEALVMWVTSLATLIFAHLIMLGIFTANEIIVDFCGKEIENTQISFTFNWLENMSGSIGNAGKIISSVINSIGSLFGNSDASSFADTTLNGYQGMLITFLLRALTGDLVYSIVFGIILGQTVALIIQYLRRLFYCIILGILAPLIIAVDVIKKSINV